MTSFKYTSEFNEMISKHFEPLIEAIIEETEETTFTTQKKESTVQKFKDFLISERSNIAKAFELIGEFLPTFLNPQELEKVKNESLEGGKKILSGEVTLFTEEADEKDSLHEMLGISEETISHFYTVGTILYEKDRLEDAQKVLSVVVILNPFVSLFWFSNGIILHRLGHFEEAVQSYKISSILNPENPEPLYFAVSAFLDNHDTYSAQIVYDMLNNVIVENKLQEAWQPQINTLKLRFK